MNLLKRRVRGADCVGQPPHGVGDDQDDPGGGQWRAEARKIPSMKNPQVTDRQHDSGNRQWQGSDSVQQIPTCQSATQQQKGDGRAENDIETCG